MEIFYETARDVPELPFGVTATEEVFASYGIRKDTAVVFRKVGVTHNGLGYNRL